MRSCHNSSSKAFSLGSFMFVRLASSYPWVPTSEVRARQTFRETGWLVSSHQTQGLPSTREGQVTLPHGHPPTLLKKLSVYIVEVNEGRAGTLEEGCYSCICVTPPALLM